MNQRDIAALDGYQFLPRGLHDVTTVDLTTSVLGVDLVAPIVLRRRRGDRVTAGQLAVLPAAVALSGTDKHASSLTIAVLPPLGMADLVAQVRELATRGVAAVGLDLAPLAESAPYGAGGWYPRTREDVAELRAAAGCPLWLFGVASAADAEVAAEAGADCVVVSGDLGSRVAAPAAIDLLPEIVDAVGGMLSVAAGGPLRDGVDVLRYLAVGAELVVVDGDRDPTDLLAELSYAMRLTGCANLGDVGYDLLFAPLFDET
ncbi:MAG TPA: alpha-hydroxy-acid oxidizing protein [Trueperaceae bacterium]|nr:alpha-hydroxy-acid oxidizing protein [Trueperaceae bacterium]